MADWDPIDVRDEPCAADEYEAYIPKIKALLRRGTSIQELMEYLDEVATQRMGLTPQRERGRTASEHLLSLAVFLTE
jgi:hypothetical protein